MKKMKSLGLYQNHLKNLKINAKVQGIIIGAISAIIGFLIGKYM